MKKKRKVRGRITSQCKKAIKEVNINDFNHIESLLVADTTGLLQKVQAAIFLLLKKL
ncbi:45721_t:CDS:2 [Gigaspora margarita]|uniref:45721_t:CDS:1 n=1 Tax=Gigaspora margarita TaxID=4874 RepID=A0ABM8W6K0_GIGMA|nr:45721_t:CDS:2 [Gigaspora margarita]